MPHYVIVSQTWRRATHKSPWHILRAGVTSPAPMQEGLCGTETGASMHWQVVERPGWAPFGGRACEACVRAYNRGVEAFAAQGPRPAEAGPVICASCDVEYPSMAALDQHQRTEAARDAEATPVIESNAAGGTAAERQISEQRAHLANVLEAYHRLIAGDLPWSSFAASPDLAEALAWKKVVEARDTLHAWTATSMERETR